MFCKVNNTDIYYDRIGNKAASEKLLFVHGASSFGSFWLPVTARLMSFDCIVLDLPGHYRSKGTACDSVSAYAEFINDFVSVLFQTPQQENEQLLVYVGHSLGGAIGQELALSHPDWMKQLVLINTESKLEVPESFLQSLEAGTYDASFFFTRGFGSKAKPSLKEAINRHQVVSVESCYRDFYAASKFDRQSEIAKIDVATLVLAGEEDKVASPEGSRYLYDHIPNAKLQTVPGVGHFLPLEDPGTTAKAIREFVTTPAVEEPIDISDVLITS